VRKLKILKELRTQKQITQQELADFLKVNRNAISRYESGEREPDISTLLKISEFFDVSVDYLIGNNFESSIDTTNNNSDEKKSFLPGIDELTPENKEDLKKYFELLKIKQKVDENNNAKTSSSLKENA
jgi:transcriptional regulator with XRE-family HTH domain